MFKMKIKLSVKKCFKMMVSGKVKVGQVGKCYGMIKCIMKFICDVCGIIILCEVDSKIVKKYMLYVC